jgi:hypothetical protein
MYVKLGATNRAEAVAAQFRHAQEAEDHGLP